MKGAAWDQSMRNGILESLEISNNSHPSFFCACIKPLQSSGTLHKSNPLKPLLLAEKTLASLSRTRLLRSSAGERSKPELPRLLALIPAHRAKTLLRSAHFPDGIADFWIGNGFSVLEEEIGRRRPDCGYEGSCGSIPAHFHGAPSDLPQENYPRSLRIPPAPQVSLHQSIGEHERDEDRNA